jgi:hypothetical protein
VSLVDRALDLVEREQRARTEAERRILSNEVSAVRRSIDERVFELFGLSPSEAAVVCDDSFLSSSEDDASDAEPLEKPRQSELTPA